MLKKVVFILFSALLVTYITSCGLSEDTKPTSTTESLPNVEESYHEEIGDLFTGNWNRPGLYEKNGNEHIMPNMVEESGMIIDVTDYGAKSGQPKFDNYSAFKNAMSNANPGDTVYIPAGTYYFVNYTKASTEYSTHISVKEGVTLKGAGKGQTILVSNFKEAMNQNENTCVIAAINVKNVAIKDLTVTSNTSDDVLPDPNNSNLQTTTYTAPKYGIVLASGGIISAASEQARNLVVDNVLVEKFQRMGVRIAKAQECVVRNSTFQKATCLGGGGMGYGVNIQGYGNNVNITDTFIDTKFNVVENNDFVGPYLRHGALVQYYAHNNLIKNNKFNSLLLDSIDMHGEDEYSNEICNNVVNNTRKGAAIGLGNTGATHDATGRNTYIHDNIIKGGARGIDVMLGTPDTVIYNNKIENVEKGITCSNSNGTRIIENEISNVVNNGISISYAYIALNPEAGIPNNYVILNNKLSNCGTGIFMDSKGNNMRIENNQFTGIESADQIVDKSPSFVLPGVSDLTKPVDGEYYLPKENFFITRESENAPAGYQKNLKLKTSNLEPKFNRLIYALFDTSEMPKTYDRVYLSFTAKAQTGTPTINFFINYTYTDWTSTSIYWNNAKLHHPTLGLIENTTEDPVYEFATFTFPVPVYDFQTYYIDVTDAYKALQSNLFTMVITNEGIDESYMEIYSKDMTQNDCEQAFRLIFA